MFQYKMGTDEVLSEKLIQKLIEKHQTMVVPRLMKLERYYHNDNDIKRRTMADSSKPNNKVAHPYAEYISSVLTGYFMSEPITYSSIGEDVNELKPILDYNDAADEDMELAKDASIFGVAYELVYIDTDGLERFRRLDPKEVIIVREKSLDEDIIYAIRYYPDIDLLTNNRRYVVEVYSNTESIKYITSEGFSGFTEISREPHYFGMVPVCVFQNNEDEIGDFENVIGLIDAYDIMGSDSINNQEYFSDAYLLLTGLRFNDDEDDDVVGNMKEQRIMLLDEGCDARWLLKDENDVVVENVKNRLDNDIHKFSKVPNMNDEAFGNNSSGVAIKYKTMAMENAVGIKERKFKKGIQRRIELIFNILSLKGRSYDWRAIDISFTRNLPTNDTEIANVVNTLRGVVSEETLIAQVPFVSDVEAELTRVSEERTANMSMYTFGEITEDEE